MRRHYPTGRLIKRRGLEILIFLFLLSRLWIEQKDFRHRPLTHDRQHRPRPLWIPYSTHRQLYHPYDKKLNKNHHPTQKALCSTQTKRTHLAKIYPSTPDQSTREESRGQIQSKVRYEWCTENHVDFESHEKRGISSERHRSFATYLSVFPRAVKMKSL